MNVLFVALLSLAAQAPARTQAPAPEAAPQSVPAPAAAPAPSEPEPEPEPAATRIEAYRGTLAEGLAEIEAHAKAGEIDSAIAVADALLAPNGFLRWRARVREQGGFKTKVFDAVDPVLDACGIEALPPAHRAAVEYARGVALAGAGRAPEAERSFEAARADAGPGSLRLDAVYNLGTLALEAGEAERAKIPEIQARAGGAPATQPAPAAPKAAGAPPVPGGGASPPGEPADDPLANARAAYLRAREQLVERVRSDWRDEDTRANLELVQRRLHELEELEKEREQKKKEDEQKQQDEQKDQKPKDQKDGQDPKDKQDEKKPEDQKPEDPSDSQGKEPPKPEDEKKSPEQETPEEQEAKKPQPEDMKEQPLSKEQMMQLLDRLKELEEQARKLQEQMQRARRVKVKKDW